MRVFVTGGTGFVGRHVVRALQARGDSVLVLSRQPAADVDSVRGDLSDMDGWFGEVERFHPEATVHLAWEGIPDYGTAASMKNLEAGLRLVERLAGSGCRTIINAGSCWEYGTPTGLVAEDTPVRPYNAFSAAKTALHWLGKEIACEHGMNFIWTRIFYVYGPGQRAASLIPHVIGSFREGRQPQLNNPRARNDFIYVGDVAAAIVKLLDHPVPYGVYNIGSGVATEVAGVAEIIASHFDAAYESEQPIDSVAAAAGFWADISRLKKDTGWTPATAIEAGIEMTLAES